MSANSDKETTDTLPEKLVCESCGETFSCGSNIENCWCFEIALSEEALAELHKDFKGCLCGKCLKHYDKKF